ncbi:hypothetical protein [Streptomyces sp. NPDC096105]|uniref:hypothetical protein n=1 Tax=Streptomyces sp. NPDC096105 TaxID=3366074 RepID=UPI00382933D2
MLIVAVLADLAWPPFPTFPLLATVPVIAAPMCSLRRTVASGAAACLAVTRLPDENAAEGSSAAAHR